MRQLDVRHLQLRPLPAQDRPVLAPVKLEGVARLEDKRHEDAPVRGLLRALPICSPLARKRRHTPVGPLVAEDNEVSVQLLDRALVLARLAGLDLQPVGKLRRKRVQLARPLGNLELRLHRAGAEVFADGVPREARAPRNLADR